MKVYHVITYEPEEPEVLGVFSTVDKAKQMVVDRWDRLKKSTDYVMYGSAVMGIIELELDNPDYEKEIDFDYGYDETIIKEINRRYWARQIQSKK